VTRSCVAVLTLLALACGGAPDSPRGVVDAYFASLGRDPLRTLPLLSPAFHRQHDLHVVTTAEALRATSRRGTVGANPDPLPPQLAPDRLQLAWLMLQVRPGFASELEAFAIEPRGEQTEGATVRVTVRVTPARGQAFDQIFSLTRDNAGAWRIEGVEQRGVDPSNAIAAYVAHPTEAARKHLESSLRRR